MRQVDPFGGREGGDWSNSQDDMRARILRERRTEAYGALTEAHPPALDKIPDLVPGPVEEIVRIVRAATTDGHRERARAERLAAAGETSRAIEAFEALRSNHPRTWFDRYAEQRLRDLEEPATEETP